MKYEFTLDSLRKVIASNDDATDLLNKSCVDFRELQEKFKMQAKYKETATSEIQVKHEG